MNTITLAKDDPRTMDVQDLIAELTPCEPKTVDDRTDEQKKTHHLAVVGRDKFLSGWGQAKGGYSRAAWACHPDVNTDRVENWVRNRGDMKHVNLVDLRTYRPRRSTVHFHIYVCDPGHPATR